MRLTIPANLLHGATMPCPSIDQLRGLLDATAGDARAIELQLHLESCAACQKALDGLVADGGFWNDAAKQLADKPMPSVALQDVVEHLQSTPLPDVNADEKPIDYFEHTLPFVGPPVEPDTLGRLKHYDILHVAGRGGMGVVVKAFDRALRRVVAIKLLAPHLASNSLARQRFVREGQATAAISHEHVVTIHAVEENPPFLVMQYVQGETLQARLDRVGPLELKEVLRIGKQIAEGLAAAHAQGVVHRDIKPANILLENGISRVKLTDFGLARAMDDASLTHSGVIAGTPQFMAPEQANGDAIDHRADLFSLGSVLYTMCAGHAPFRASTAMGVLRRVAEQVPRPLRELDPQIPDWLATLINRLHAKRPDDRPQSATEVAEILERRLASLQSARPATPHLEPTWHALPANESSEESTAAAPVISSLGEESISVETFAASTSASERSRGRKTTERFATTQEWLASINSKAGIQPFPVVLPDRLTLIVLAMVLASTVLVAAGALGRVASEITTVGIIIVTLLGVLVLIARRLLPRRLREVAPRGIFQWLVWTVAWLAPATLGLLLMASRIWPTQQALRLREEIPAVLDRENQIVREFLFGTLAVYVVVTSLWFLRRHPQGGPLYSKKERVLGWLRVAAGLGIVATACSVFWNRYVSTLAHIEHLQRDAEEKALEARHQTGQSLDLKVPLKLDWPKFADGVSVRIDYRGGNLTVGFFNFEKPHMVPLGTARWTAFVRGQPYASNLVTIVPRRSSDPITRIEIPSPLLFALEGQWIASHQLAMPPLTESFRFQNQRLEIETPAESGQVTKRSYSVTLNDRKYPAEIDLIPTRIQDVGMHGLLKHDKGIPVLVLRDRIKPRPSDFPNETSDNISAIPLADDIKLIRLVRETPNPPSDPLLGIDPFNRAAPLK